MRTLYKGILKVKLKPKPNPFSTEQSPQPDQVGMLFIFDVEGEKVEEWVNAPVTQNWHEPLRKNDAFFFVREWSKKKKNKETGEEGAYAFRPVVTAGWHITEDPNAPAPAPVNAPAAREAPTPADRPAQRGRAKPRAKNGQKQPADYGRTIKAAAQRLTQIKDPDTLHDALSAFGDMIASWPEDKQKAARSVGSYHKERLAALRRAAGQP